MKNIAGRGLRQAETPSLGPALERTSAAIVIQRLKAKHTCRSEARSQIGKAPAMA